MLARVELRHLEHFLAVAEEQSFTRAAARVHVVQSSLSESVRALERELGAQLFDRTAQPVELTDAGRALVEEARRTVAAADAARDAVAAVEGGTRGTLRVGIMHALSAIDLAGLLWRFHTEHPGVRIAPSTHPDGSEGLARAVAEHRLDVAFAAVSPAFRPDVTLTTLTREEIVLVCPAAHRLARRSKVALENLRGERFIDVPNGWGSRTSVDNLLSERGIPREIVIEVADVPTVCQLVRAGLGLALLAPSSAPGEDRRYWIPVDPPPIFTVSLVTPARRRLPAAARAFVDLVETSIGSGSH